MSATDVSTQAGVAMVTDYLGMNPALTSYSIPVQLVRWIFICLIFGTNTCTLLAVSLTETLRKAKISVYVRSLCLSNMLLGLGLLLGSIAEYTGMWPLSPTLTQRQVDMKRVTLMVLSFPYLVGTVTSFLTFLATAVDRYFAISRPLTYKTQFTKTSSRISLLFIWGYTICLAAAFTSCFTLAAPDTKVAAAYYLFDAWPVLGSMLFTGVHELCLVAPAILLFVVTLLAMKRQMRNLQAVNTGGSHLTNASRRMTRMMACTLGALLLFSAPFTIINACVDRVDKNTPQSLINLSIMARYLLYCNSWINLFIYYHFNKDYNTAYRRLLSRCLP